MHLIELLIHTFLEKVNKGSYTITPDLLERFGDETKSALKKHLEPEPREFTIRGSNIGKPLCILEREQAGIKGVSDNNILRNLYGDLVEDTLLFILYAAGVPIVAEQELVSLEIAGQTINGTFDIIIHFDEDEVWDIKSASDWSFKNKFNKSFEDFIKEDFFGYTDQLFFYGAARGCKVGGWIIQNKSTGEVKVMQAPAEQQSYREASLRRMEEKVTALHSSSKSKRDASVNVLDNSNSNKYSKCFLSVPELFRKKSTGNMMLHTACTFCEFKFNCWSDVQLKTRANSTAKNPPLIWYTQFKEDIDGTPN